MVFIVLCGGGGGPIVFMLFGMAFQTSLLKTIAWVLGMGAVIFFGLRSTMVVTESQVTITKKWFFVPYWRWTAAAIDDVWFGGDWGEEDGALGVVVQLGKDEVHIGSTRTMRELHDKLWPLSIAGRRSVARAVQ